MNVLAFQVPKRIFPVMCQDKPPSSARNAEPRRPSNGVKENRQSTVILLRHAMTDWNQEGRVQGGLDKSRLNDTGLAQARRAGAYLKNIPIESVLCSPLRRATETFDVLAQSSSNPDLLEKEPDLLPDLMEFHVPWQGSLVREITKGRFRQEYIAYKKNPMRFSYYGFNPIRDISRRAENVWDAIARSETGSYLIISHNQMNKALISNALDMPTNLSTWNQRNCTFNVFLVEDGKPVRLRLCNGVDLFGDTKVSHRSRLKQRFLRLVLHLQGHIDGLLKETAGQTISHACYVGKVPSDHFKASAVYQKGESCSSTILPEDQGDEDVYASCLELLEGIRRQHGDGFAIVSTEDASVHSALVSACLGLGHEAITRFHSDPGGVTIIDVDSLVEVGTGRVTVECHNNYAYLSDSGDFLQGYTSFAQSAELTRRAVRKSESKLWS